MIIPVGFVDQVKDFFKRNYPIALRVWTHNGQRAHWTNARIQVFEGALFIKFFTTKQSYTAPDLKFSHIDGKLKVEMSGWKGSTVQDKNGNTVYEVYLANDYELYPMDIRNDEGKARYVAWKEASEKYGVKMRLSVPQLSFADGVTDEQKQQTYSNYKNNILAEQSAAKKELDEAFARMDAWNMRDKIFFDPQLTSSATQTVITGFGKIAEYGRSKEAQRMLMGQLFVFGLFVLIIGVVVYLYYDNTQKLSAASFNAAVEMSKSMPGYIQECIKQGFISNVTKPGV